jgi:hypothetical protein
MAIDTDKSPTYMNKTHEVWCMILANPGISETELRDKLPHIVEGTIGASVKMLYEYGHITRTGSGQFNQRKRELFKFNGVDTNPYKPFYGIRPEVQENHEAPSPKRVVLDPSDRGTLSARKTRSIPVVRTSEQKPPEVRRIVAMSVTIRNETILISAEEGRQLYEDLRAYFGKN